MNAPAEIPCWPGSSLGVEQRALVYEAVRALPDKIAPVVALVEKIAPKPREQNGRMMLRCVLLLSALATVYLVSVHAGIFPQLNSSITQDLLCLAVIGPMFAVFWVTDGNRHRKSVLLAAQAETSEWVLSAWMQESNEIPIEAKLAALAARTAIEIEDHRAWLSDWLDTQRIRFDPSEGSRQTCEGLRQLYEIRRSIGPAPSPSIFGGRPRQVHDRQLAELRTVQDTLADRIAATRAYLVKLDELGVLLDAQESMNRSVCTDTQVAELVGRSAQDQLATDALIGLAGELEFVTQGLRAAIAFLDGPGQLPQNGTAGTSSQRGE